MRAVLFDVDGVGAVGVPVNTRPWLSEMPDSVVPPVASFESLVGASTSRSLMPMKRPTWVESTMMRLSSLVEVNLASGPINQDLGVATMSYSVASMDALPTTGCATAAALTSTCW